MEVLMILMLAFVFIRGLVTGDRSHPYFTVALTTMIMVGVAVAFVVGVIMSL
jgi:hypothetical protein